MKFSAQITLDFDQQFNLTMGNERHWTNIGPLHSEWANLCTYAMDDQHLAMAWEKPNVRLIFVPTGVTPPTSGPSFIQSDSPQYDFFRFHNWFVQEGYYTYYPEFAKVSYPDWPLYIGPGTEIDDTAQIGSEGLRVVNRPDGTRFRCLHGGYVRIGNDSRVGAHSVVVRSMWRTPTTIGDRVNIGNRVTIGHNTIVEDDVIIMPGAIICGRAVVKRGATVCAGAIVNNGVTVGENATVSAGSLVTKDVKPWQRVTGNFAVEHERWVHFVKNIVDVPHWDDSYFCDGSDRQSFPGFERDENGFPGVVGDYEES